MARFVCGTCGATLSTDLAPVPMPPYFEVDSDYDNAMTETSPPALMAQGTYAVDPKPFGPPHLPLTSELARRHDIDDATITEWHRTLPRRSERRWGRRAMGPSVAETMHLSAGPSGTFVVNPDDVKGVHPHDNPNRLGGCCHLDGGDGPNMLCTNCHQEVATFKNDCWVGRSTLRSDPEAVRTVP